jgi:hypothetical protein
MKFSELLKHKLKDKVEITKQQQAEIQKVFDSRIIPKKNHTLFEFNILTNTIEVADFKPPNTIIHWVEALEMYYKKKLVKIDISNPKTKTKSELIKKDNCIYISALNKSNVIKILKRDFQVFI